MPKRPRPGEWEVLYGELPAALKLKLRLAQQAERNRRSAIQELIQILDATLPPAVEESPKPPPAPVAAPKPRGRPPKKKPQ